MRKKIRGVLSVVTSQLIELNLHSERQFSTSVIYLTYTRTHPPNSIEKKISIQMFCGSWLFINSIPQMFCGTWLWNNPIPQMFCARWLWIDMDRTSKVHQPRFDSWRWLCECGLFLLKWHLTNMEGESRCYKVSSSVIDSVGRLFLTAFSSVFNLSAGTIKVIVILIKALLRFNFPFILLVT